MCLNPTILVHPSAKRQYMLGKFDSFCFDGFSASLTHVSFGFKHWFYNSKNGSSLTPYERYKDNLLDLDKHFYFFNSETGETFPMFFVAPCNKCRDCFRSKYIEYSSRLTLESFCQDYPPIFFTLTYDNEHLPSDGSVSKSDISAFIKRMQTYFPRYGFKNSVPRFFIVSEYGPLHGRPHYHGLLFGVDLAELEDYFTFDDLLYSAWGKCAKHCIKFEVCRSGVATTKYVCKYIIKGLKESNIPDGCAPNFISTPRRVGLGVPALSNPVVVKAILSSQDGTISLPFVSKYSSSSLGVSRFKIPKFIIDKLFPQVSKVLSSNVKRHLMILSQTYKELRFRLPFFDLDDEKRMLSVCRLLNFDPENIDPYFIPKNFRFKPSFCSESKTFELFHWSLQYLYDLCSDFALIPFDEQSRHSFKSPITRRMIDYVRSHPDGIKTLSFVRSCHKESLLDISLNL